MEDQKQRLDVKERGIAGLVQKRKRCGIPYCLNAFASCRIDPTVEKALEMDRLDRARTDHRGAGPIISEGALEVLRSATLRAGSSQGSWPGVRHLGMSVNHQEGKQVRKLVVQPRQLTGARYGC